MNLYADYYEENERPRKKVKHKKINSIERYDEEEVREREEPGGGDYDRKERKLVTGKIVVTDMTKKVTGPRRKKKFSAYMLTLNTQRRYPNEQDPELPIYVKAFQETLSKIFLDDETFKGFIYYTGHNSKEKLKPIEIDKITNELYIERGDEYGCPHAHGLLQIEHYSCIGLDFEDIKKTFKKKFNKKLRQLGITEIVNYYLNLEIQKQLSQALSSQAAIYEYFRKNIPNFNNNPQQLEHKLVKGKGKSKSMEELKRFHEHAEKEREQMPSTTYNESYYDINDEESNHPPTFEEEDEVLPTTPVRFTPDQIEYPIREEAASPEQYRFATNYKRKFSEAGLYQTAPKKVTEKPLVEHIEYQMPKGIQLMTTKLKKQIEEEPDDE